MKEGVVAVLGMRGWLVSERGMRKAAGGGKKRARGWVVKVFARSCWGSYEKASYYMEHYL